MIEGAIIARLLGLSTVTDLVGQRVRPNEAAQSDSLPYVTVQRISTVPEHSMEGPSGFVSARVQVDSWASTYASARAIADAVRAVLDGYENNATIYGEPLPGTLHVMAIMRMDERDLPEPPAHGQPASVFRISQDYLCNYAEPE